MWHCLLTDGSSIETRARKYVKGNGNVPFAKRYEKQLLDTELVSLKTVSQKVVHKAGDILWKSNLRRSN